jgi:hypothetical protein
LAFIYAQQSTVFHWRTAYHKGDVGAISRWRHFSNQPTPNPNLNLARQGHYDTISSFKPGISNENDERTTAISTSSVPLFHLVLGEITRQIYYGFPTDCASISHLLVLLLE